MQVPYQVGIGPASGAAPTLTLSVFDSWTLSRNLDDGCSFSFSCPGDSLIGAAISELDTDVWVYQDSVLIDRFRIAEVQQTWNADGRDDVSVSAVCYRRILASRFVVSPLSYTATSQGTIVWNLISHTQAQTNGNLGITLGSSGPAIPRTRSYDVGQNILEAITDLGTIANGIVWDIDGSRVLTVRTADQFPVQPQPAVLGVNVDGMSRPSGAARFANVAIVSGDAIATTLQITPAPTLGADPRGRWERYAGFPSEITQTALQQAADGIITTNQSPAVIWSMSFVPDRYWTDSAYGLGDFITIVPPLTTVAPLGPSTPVEAQIITQEISVTADGDATVTMTAIETPHPVAASVSTSATTSITTSTATMNGNYLSAGSGYFLGGGFVYATTPNPVLGGAGVTDLPATIAGLGAFSANATGLASSTTYYVRAYITTTVGTAYGADATFATNHAVSYIVIAGGGGAQQGGGGAGGYRSSIAAESSGGGAAAEAVLSIAPSTGFTVTVGGGGAGSSSASLRGTNGSNSVLSTITATGGGGGGGRNAQQQGATGGSGGGSVLQPGGAGTASQGYAGGLASFSFSGNGSGGGGAGALGGNAGTAAITGGNGGNGVTSSVTGTAITRGGGGGGGGTGGNGTGGTGGGGAAPAGAGAANTGGGGGGRATTGTAGAGGSGVVFIRYVNTAPDATIGVGLTIDNGSGGNVVGTGAPLAPSFTPTGWKVYMVKAGTGTVSI